MPGVDCSQLGSIRSLPMRCGQEGNATDARNLATKARDESFECLRDRIVGLRNELEQ